jgi:hypothetical protein
MKTKENDFFIDKLIVKYQSLSKEEKTYINLAIALTMVVFIIGSFYNSGKAIGEFLYNITH